MADLIPVMTQKAEADEKAETQGALLTIDELWAVGLARVVPTVREVRCVNACGIRCSYHRIGMLLRVPTA